VLVTTEIINRSVSYDKAIMTTDITEAGTMREIKKGTRVQVYAATNLPNDSPFKWFVEPLGRWSGDTMAVYADDIKMELMK